MGVRPLGAQLGATPKTVCYRISFYAMGWILMELTQNVPLVV